MPPAIPYSEIKNSPLAKEREEMKASTLNDAMNGKASKGFTFHIEINALASEGNTMHTIADVTNQDDLARIHQMYERYMPRTGFFAKWLGV